MSTSLESGGQHGVHASGFKGKRFVESGGRSHGDDVSLAAFGKNFPRRNAENEAENPRTCPQDGFRLLLKVDRLLLNKSRRHDVVFLIKRGEFAGGTIKLGGICFP